jgi:hypothetical protein
MHRNLRIADLGEDEDLFYAANGRPLFQPVVVDWSRPVRIARDGSLPLKNEEELFRNGYLYAIVRNHGNQTTRDRIAYIGITNDLEKRFKNHPKVDEIRSQYGETSISIGTIETPNRRPNGETRKLIREEIEHILIWVLHEDLWNDRKVMCVPGQGRNGGRALDIENTGFTFSGRMPRRIVFPWPAVVPRRNNTSR